MLADPYLPRLSHNWCFMAATRGCLGLGRREGQTGGGSGTGKEGTGRNNKVAFLIASGPGQAMGACLSVNYLVGLSLYLTT